MKNCFVETFISDRRRSVLKNIQDNFEDAYEKAGSALESGDFIVCCLLIINKFYELYYYNNVQNDVNAVVVKAMKANSAMSWEEAAPILYEAMDNIMEGMDQQRVDSVYTPAAEVPRQCTMNC